MQPANAVERSIPIPPWAGPLFVGIAVVGVAFMVFVTWLMLRLRRSRLRRDAEPRK
jgi:hypothetical protein